MRIQLRHFSSAARHCDANSLLLPPVASLPSIVAQVGMDDSSDILGGQLNVAREEQLLSASGFSFSSLFFYSILAIASLYGLQFLYPHYRQFQEKRYRKFVY